MSIFVVPSQPAAQAAEDKKEPVVHESFTVIVESPECRCSVVATGDVDAGVRRVWTLERCNDNRKQPGPEHEQRLHELAQIAQRRMKLLISDVWEARRPV